MIRKTRKKETKKVKVDEKEEEIETMDRKIIELKN